MTMFDARTKLSEQVVQEVQKYFGDLVYGVIIPRTVRLSEPPASDNRLTVYDAKSKGAEAYRQLAREVALRPPPDTPMPHYDKISVAVMAPMDKVVTVEDEESAPDGQVEQEQVADRDEPAVGSSAHPAGTPPVAAPEPERIEPEAAPPVEVVPPTEAKPAPRPESTPQLSDEELWEEPPAKPEPRVKPPSSPARPGELPQRRVVVIDENSEIDIQGAREVPPASPELSEPREGSRTSGRRWMTRGAKSADGACSAREAIDVQTRGSGTRALSTDPGGAGSGGSEHGTPRGPCERDRPQPEAAEEPVRRRHTEGVGGVDPRGRDPASRSSCAGPVRATKSSQGSDGFVPPSWRGWPPSLSS